MRSVCMQGSKHVEEKLAAEAHRRERLVKLLLLTGTPPCQMHHTMPRHYCKKHHRVSAAPADGEALHTTKTYLKDAPESPPLALTQHN